MVVILNLEHKDLIKAETSDKYLKIVHEGHESMGGVQPSHQVILGGLQLLGHGRLPRFDDNHDKLCV
jgi:hypothetical protein